MVPPEPVDAIIFQAERTYDLRRVAELTKQVRHGGVLWVLWPTTERRVSEAHVERAGNAAGMTRTRITGVTGRFTGMKFIHRFADGR
jgi:tRNA(Met) C34 N-acetyltransferase TmcA